MPAEASSAVVGEHKEKSSTLWCACRATELPCLVTKADAQLTGDAKSPTTVLQCLDAEIEN